MAEIDYQSAEFPSPDQEKPARYANVLVPESASAAWCKMFTEAYGHSNWRATVVGDRYKHDRAGRPSLPKNSAPYENVYTTIMLDKVSPPEAANGTIVGARLLTDYDHPAGPTESAYIVLRNAIQRVSLTHLTNGPDDEILMQLPVGTELRLYIDDRTI